MNPPSVPLESPALAVGRGVSEAFELKFQLPSAAAGAIEAWAWQHLRPDVHGRDAAYHITTAYCDTPALDTYHRSMCFRRSKHRLRRYEAAPQVFLEHKTKRGDRVRKRRTGVPVLETAWLAGPFPATPWLGDWFLRRIQFRNLRPTCLVGYDRVAFMGLAPEGPVRLTIDHNLRGAPASGWDVPPLYKGRALLPDAVLVELKYSDSLPTLFRELLQLLPASPARVSKYRLCVEASGLAGEGG